VEFAGQILAETRAGYRVLETSHPPVYYFPPDSVNQGLLLPENHSTVCEWKGRAKYFALTANGQERPSVAWMYPAPVGGFGPIAGYFAFYASRVDACFVNDERVIPQPGDFYGGWITCDIVGPFKGEAGSWGW
jgi:uncharacterized protein (DUF427 family)